MTKADQFRENADHCGELAENAKSEPLTRRYLRMEAAWRALAQEQDWLDGQISPVSRADDSGTETASS